MKGWRYAAGPPVYDVSLTARHAGRLWFPALALAGALLAPDASTVLAGSPTTLPNPALAERSVDALGSVLGTKVRSRDEIIGRIVDLLAGPGKSSTMVFLALAPARLPSPGRNCASNERVTTLWPLPI
jgi:hypothetical protein